MTEDTVRPTAPVPPAAPAGRAGWSLVLPLKPLPEAKSRLAPYAGARRPELALAFALDTVAAALACPAVGRAVVVTTDPVAGARLAALGAVVVPDEPGGGLNAALAHGAEHARRLAPWSPLAALSADLPALRPLELGQVLAAAGALGRRAFLADTPGSGTTLLACRPGARLSPAFGPSSAARHAASGATELRLPAPSVRRDVDTGPDLSEALALGVGPHTAAVAAVLV
ncbi:2-phospho-L-lactate guanylyltransferase [Kitasatospora sp. NPDC002227]|uniref:2-phospho-L-lactate guanylyltransferase n=1 Tax=Kitasatospora sp. NPDC002227 TaxID=3154773 RepID=UPI003324F574